RATRRDSAAVMFVPELLGDAPPRAADATRVKTAESTRRAALEPPPPPVRTRAFFSLGSCGCRIFTSRSVEPRASRNNGLARSATRFAFWGGRRPTGRGHLWGGCQMISRVTRIAPWQA